MSKIKKELKNATFEYDEEAKSFTISGEHPVLRDVNNSVELNKVYAFAFMRFVIRMAQRNWLRNKKANLKSSSPCAIPVEEDSIDPDQMLFFEKNEELEI
tara:strand:- start:4761 stop:5060 length:300 start_codon:yes stop_codon:yes gene_type:complete